MSVAMSPSSPGAAAPTPQSPEPGSGTRPPEAQMPDHGQVVTLHDGILGKAACQVAGAPRGFNGVTGQGQCNGRNGFGIFTVGARQAARRALGKRQVTHQNVTDRSKL